MKPEKREQQTPSDWIDTTFGNVAEYITSGSRDWSKYYSNHGAMFIRTQDINTNRLRLDDVARVALPEKVEGKRTRVFKDDILITITGANVGKVALVDQDIGEAYVSQSVALVRLKDKQLGKFLHYQLMTRVHGDKTPLESMAYGLGRPVLNLDNIRVVPIRLAPLDQQNRIVAEIEKQFSRLDEAVANLKRVKANLKRYKAAVLKAAVEGKLVPTEAQVAGKEGRTYETGAQLLERILTERRQQWNGKGRYKEPAKPDTMTLPALPEGWTWLRIDAIAFVTKLAGFEYTKYVKYAPAGDLAVIKAENASRTGFKRTEFSRVNSSTVSQLSRSRLETGDLLMVFVGAGTGNVARVPGDQPYFLGPNIGMIRVKSTYVTPSYLEIFLRSPMGNFLALGFRRPLHNRHFQWGQFE